MLRDGKYAFSGYRGVAIPKKPDASRSNPKDFRPISIASIQDRIVQRAILERIWFDIRDKVCTKSSFGGIRKYSNKSGKPDYDLGESSKGNIYNAVKRICDLRAAGRQWVFETDIENFYPSVNREVLFSKLFPLRDDSINELIKNVLDTSVSNDSQLGELATLWNPDLGVPQGGTLSPVLANLYLHEFDQVMEKRGFEMVRYVDDLIVLCFSEVEAKEAYALSESLLKRLGLSIHELGASKNGRVKTGIHPPNEKFDFLGLTFTSKTILPKQAKFDLLKTKILDITDVKTNKDLLLDVIKYLNWSVKGWVNSYSFCNLQRDQDLELIDRWVNNAVRRWMRFRGLIKDEAHVSASAFKWLGIVSATEIRIDPILKFFKCGKEARELVITNG